MATEVEKRARMVGAGVKDVVRFKGHPLVRSMHPTTIEVTTEEHLSERGDCIIGVASDKGCAQLDQGLKGELRKAGSRVRVTIRVGGLSYSLHGSGDPRLELSHPNDIVVRKSEFVSERTLVVRADAAAKDIPRRIVESLKDPGSVGTLEIEVL